MKYTVLSKIELTDGSHLIEFTHNNCEYDLEFSVDNENHYDRSSGTTTVISEIKATLYEVTEEDGRINPVSYNYKLENVY